MGSLWPTSGLRWLGAPSVAIALVLTQAGPALGEGGLDITSDTRYEILVSEGLLRVEAQFDLKNTLKNKDDGFYVTRYYYQTFTVPVPETAVNLVATSGNSQLTVDVREPEDGSFNMADIRLRRYIYSGQTQTIKFSYDLPNEPVRSDQFVRVNSAFSSFGMWGVGDPDQVTIRLSIPEGFSIETVGDEMSYTVTADGPMWVADDIADPDDWYVWVAARDDSGLTATQITVDGRSALIRAWPDDPEWEQFAKDQFRTRLPVMEDLIGVPWPVAGELEIIETVTPSLYGAAGWFLTDHDVIEISEDLDEQVMLHELAHAWFSRDTFEHRWLSEGLAEELSYRTLEADGEGRSGGNAPDSSQAFPLNTWKQYTSGQVIDSGGRETYGYDASGYVLRRITLEIGMDGLKRVLQAADSGEMVYSGATDSESPRFDWEQTDWKRFLDLAEELGDSDRISAIFDKYVATRSEQPLLEQRKGARLAYAELLDHGDSWAAPISVRLAMEEWNFARAGDLMADAETVLELRDRITREAIHQGVQPHTSLQDDYESAFHEVHWVIGKGEAQLAAVEAVTDATNAVTAGRSIWASIGLWGANLDADLDQVRATFEGGDTDATMFQAVEVIAEVDAGTGVGMKRAGIGASSLILTLGLGLAGNRLVHRRRGFVDTESANSSEGLFEHPIFELDVEDFSSWVPRVLVDSVPGKDT